MKGAWHAMLTAVVRPPSAALTRCELTYLERDPIDIARAVQQHAAYVRCLRDLGASIIELPTAPDLPDATFVEDTAVVTDECAVLTRPGAASRRAEVGTVAETLRPYRPLLRIEPPGILDGGDVLRIGRRVFVGVGGRTNAAGAAQLRRHLAPFGYDVIPTRFQGCLHLKTACTWLGGTELLANTGWVDTEQFAGCRITAVPDDEPFAANVLLAGDELLMPAGFPQTQSLVERIGRTVRTVDISEPQKAEAGVTCLSILCTR